jgi:hypothetical protein
MTHIIIGWTIVYLYIMLAAVVVMATLMSKLFLLMWPPIIALSFSIINMIEKLLK